MPNDFTQKIHDCAMESDDNLIVFVRAAQSFEEFYKTLVSSFLKKLKEELMKKFSNGNGWQFFAINLIAKQHKNWEYLLSFRSESWAPATLRVGIWANTRFNDVQYGVCWDQKEDSTHNRQLHNYIFSTMSQKFNGGAIHTWQPFYIRNFRFSNWSKEDVIISMRQVIKREPPGEILDFFYNELVAIVEMLDNCINEWNRRNPNP